MADPVGLLFLGLLCLVAAVVSLVLLGRIVGNLRTLGQVVDSATPLDELAGAGQVHVVAEYRGRGDGHLAQVVDRFGYWLLRNAQTTRSDIFVRALIRRLYDVETVEDGIRRREALVAPSPLPVAAGGQHYELELGEDALGLVRFEADGGTLPFLVLFVVGLPTLLAVFLLPLLSFLGGFGLLALGVLAALWAPVVAAKGYHDRPLLGWDGATGDLETAPGPVRSAVSVAVAGKPRLVFHRRLAPGERVQVVGRVERDGDRLRLVDGFVTPRGNWFARLATTVGLVRSVVYFLIAALVTVGTGALLYASLVGPLPAWLPLVG